MEAHEMSVREAYRVCRDMVKGGDGCDRVVLTFPLPAGEALPEQSRFSHEEFGANVEKWWRKYLIVRARSE